VKELQNVAANFSLVLEGLASSPPQSVLSVHGPCPSICAWQQPPSAENHNRNTLKNAFSDAQGQTFKTEFYTLRKLFTSNLVLCKLPKN